MDWSYNSIIFKEINQSIFFQKDFNEKSNEKGNFKNSEYAIIWHLKEKLNSFDNLSENDKLLYLELNASNIKNFKGIEKFKNLKRLEVHHCTKLENDCGLSSIKESLEILHINTSKKFIFTDELLQFENLKVLRLNSCGPIENLDFLKNFPKLTDFRFVKTNILDGNLNPIIEHPTISSVGFSDKRHYNNKSENIKSILKNKRFDNIYLTKS